MRKAEVLYGTMDAMCGLLNATHVKNIAVVGNGPVTSEQRDQIQHADRVVRFNALNNRLMQEASDVWIVRYSGKPPSHFWGLGTLDKGELVDILRTSQLVLFLGGPDPPRYIPMDQMLELMRKVLPDTPPSKLLQIKFERYRHVYNSVLSSSLTLEKPEAEPSSGLLGLLATLGCIASDATVNVYGFNWSGKAYELHFMEDERRIVSRLQRRYPGLQIHPTACAGNLYSCSEACDRVLYRKAIDGDNPAICKVRRFHEEHGRPNFGVLDSLGTSQEQTPEQLQSSAAHFRKSIASTITSQLVYKRGSNSSRMTAEVPNASVAQVTAILGPELVAAASNGPKQVAVKADNSALQSLFGYSAFQKSLRYGASLYLNKGLKFTYDKASRVLKVSGTYSMHK
ncbi:hypothetical protein WJX72_008410 [[Myrmecia] bisecta]|uniref:Uncharacterized protein n=1 Tax=[Myrmecia] bisecta TaxID=41462 RepID=A0AAW1PLT8_9CHLO